MAKQITTYEEALLRVAELFARPRHPKALGIVLFRREAAQRFRVYPYSLSSQHALRDAQGGESLELVAVAHASGPLDIRNPAVAYRPLGARDPIALRIEDDLYHMDGCGPKESAAHLFTLGDEPAGEGDALFARCCASCGEPILRAGALLAARAFFAARESGGGQHGRAS